MSRVSNCILSFSSSDDEPDRISEINAYFEGAPGFVSADDANLPRGWYGGNKMLEVPLLIGAFNYFDETAFLKHLATAVKWKHPEYIQLIIQRQEDDMFEILQMPSNSDERDK